MRSKVEPGAHFGWSHARHGEPADGETDSDGLVELSVPKFVVGGREIGEVTWVVRHPDYVEVIGLDLRVDDDPAVVTLQHGRRIIVSAVDERTKQPIRRHLHGLVSGDQFVQEWNRFRDGTLMSPTVDWSNSLLRVVQLPDDGPALFSPLIDLSDFGKSRRTVVRDVPLSSGTRVVGRLADNVTRPVTNGHVSVASMLHSGIKVRNRQIVWNHWVPIAADGSFVIESLPRDTIGQLIAVCDGWVSAPTDPDQFEKVGLGEFRGQENRSRVTPHVLAIEGKSVDCVLKMAPATSCHVTVVTDNGIPIPNTKVSMSPNQLWYGRGSQLVGDGYRQDLALKLRPEEKRLIKVWSKRTDEFLSERGIRPPDDTYQRYTDKNGIAVITRLPGGTAQSPRKEGVCVWHEEYEATPIDGRGVDYVELIRGQIAEITVTMDPKGTRVLGQ